MLGRALAPPPLCASAFTKQERTAGERRRYSRGASAGYRGGMVTKRHASAFVAFAALMACGNEPTATSGASRGGGGATPTLASSDGSVETLQELCVTTINAYRERKGLPPYERWTDAETCADGEAKSDAATNRAHGAFPRCGELAQNECPGISGSPERALTTCLEMMWDEGPGGGHYDTMASSKYSKVACGFFVTESGALWSVQDFR